MKTRGQQPLIDLIRRAIAREEYRIERAREGLRKLKDELLELGIEPKPPTPGAGKGKVEGPK